MASKIYLNIQLMIITIQSWKTTWTIVANNLKTQDSTPIETLHCYPTYISKIQNCIGLWAFPGQRERAHSFSVHLIEGKLDDDLFLDTHVFSEMLSVCLRRSQNYSQQSNDSKTENKNFVSFRIRYLHFSDDRLQPVSTF